MISLLGTIFGLVVGGGSIWGLALRVAGWFGWGGVASVAGIPIIGPVLELVSQLCLKLLDFLLWLLKGVLRWFGGGLDVVSKSPSAAALVVCVAFGAWKFGPGDWRFWDATAPPAVTAPEHSRSTPRRAPSRKSCTDPLSACFWGL